MRPANVDKLRAWLDKAYAALAASPDLNMPDRADAESLMLEIMTDRTGSGRPVVLRRPRKGTSDRGRYLHTMYRWHGSGGSLWGPMGGLFLVPDAADRDAIDTLALIMRGGNSSAASAWRRAMYGEA